MVFCRVGSQRSVAALARCQAGFSGLWYVVLAGRPGRRSECPGDLSLELNFVTSDKLLTLSEVQFAACKIGIIVYHRIVTWIK